MNIAVETSTYCQICSGHMETLIEFPRMPICGVYEPWEPAFNDRGYVDQSLLYCEGCSHARLGTIVPELYGHGYAATASSAGSSAGVANFARFITDHLTAQRFSVVVDIGGNDGSLAKFFPDRRFISIDPNASGEGEIIKDFIENADIEFLKGLDHKLFCSSHTLEHIERPEAMLEKIKSVLKFGDYCAFQFPSLEYLVRDCRIDQIYHEHIHYYSMRSASLLLAKHGFKILAHRFDGSHYGALMVIFRKEIGESKGHEISVERIELAHKLFKGAALALDKRIREEGGLIGYGAAQMLPLLHYHLPSLHRLQYVMDDDEAKHGKRYANFNVQIRPVHSVDGLNVMVTAFNTKMAVRKIVEKLFSMKAENVIVPFSYL